MRTLYLSGKDAPELEQYPWFGYIFTLINLPRASISVEPQRFAADNGCFTEKFPFDPAAYLAWLRTLPDGCLFATAPDVVGDADATLARSLPFLPQIRAAGVPAAFVAQDGLTIATTPWDEFDAFFVGGSTQWKLGPAAARLADEAKARGKWLHMGRVNSFRRMRYAVLAGYDSVDGTFLRFGRDFLSPRLISWFEGR